MRYIRGKKLIFGFTSFCLLAAIVCSLVLTGCASTPYRKRARDYSQRDYVSLDEFCKKYNFKYSFDTIDDVVRLTSPDREIQVMLNSNVGYSQGTIFYLQDSPLYMGGKILLPLRLAEMISTREIVSFKPPFTIETIVIDPGHGGKDPGAVSRSGMREKDVNLNVAKYLKEDLERKGFRVILTRSTDVYLTLGQRVEIAKKHNADLFLSIHANANRSRSVNGVELYYLTPSRLKSQDRAKQLAKGSTFGSKPLNAKVILWDMLLTKNQGLSVELSRALYFAFKNLGFKIKPLKKAPFYVLRFAYVPSVLVEMGYLTNSYEEKMLKKKYYQKQIAEAIALGVSSLNNRYKNYATKK